ncbi:spore protease YyaC [Clostridium sp. AL.422]|uniref:spore protease YyaC n=1 Tax=Clostridium TaxID=1485 RepID=UPI00293DD025|nr:MULTISPECIES: spore protease YyaC [unclassified Clostridium]MDV4151605.1 spore protease YyaC [Clostridium sp. AL.422]
MKHKIHYDDHNSYMEIADKIKKYKKDDTIIICVGTDKCIGDCLGPLVGSLLIENNLPLPVFGTLQSPIHALNIEEKLKYINKLHPNSFVIGVDACLGEENSIGEIHIRDYPIHPGKGVGKHLPEVGDVSIIGIVDHSDSAIFFTNRSIRLYLIMEMAKVITKALILSCSQDSKP